MFLCFLIVFLMIRSVSTVSSYSWVSLFKLFSMNRSVIVNGIGMMQTSRLIHSWFVYTTDAFTVVGLTLLNWYSLKLIFTSIVVKFFPPLVINYLLVVNISYYFILYKCFVENCEKREKRTIDYSWLLKLIFIFISAISQ